MQSSTIRFGAALVLTILPYSIGAAAAPAGAAVTPAAVIKTYADIGHAEYEDSLNGAKALRAAITAFLAKPSAETLTAARAAWKAAREPYTMTEGFRFGNPIVDEWEPRVNSWPLDEGLIDYVAPAYGATSDENPAYTLNVIAHPKIRLGAKQIDASQITKALLRQLQEAEGVTANVATGYHAIEFLLWGQDLHGTGPGAGERPYTDYDTTHCTHGNCDRRAAYLRAATDLLVADLAEMVGDWAPGGKARAALTAKGPDGGLAAILTGLGSLSYGELAGERMKLGLILHDPEEEQDCFSDNTHNEHYFDEVGMITIWLGHGVYAPPLKDGIFLRDYVMARAPQAAHRLDAAMANARASLSPIRVMADVGHMAYDQMIGPNNPAGNKLVQDAIDALVAQTRAIEGVVAALHLNVRLQDSAKFDNAGGR